MTHPGIVLVPHTHWDREWYEPFEVFRFRLVEALDAVLDMTEADADFRFTLDGQTAAIEDYLEIRPHARPRVERAVRAGQLALGPWLILLDEFLCTGETIIRNLQLGWRGAEELGGAMPVGYLPDMFGHVAQMPQILRRAGLDHTAFWRGVPARIGGHGFRWVAPDGSHVRAEYLFDGYGNGLDVLLVPDQIPRALRDYHRLTADRWSGDPILGMVGTDHMAPRPELMDWVRRFDSPEFPISVATLTDYLFARSSEDLPAVEGELRSHARGNILPGVISIRLGLKQAMARAERTVVDAERVGAAFSSTDFTLFLERAWRDIIESTAHDSVVGSGTDETVDQVASRLAESEHIARAVRDGILRELATDAPSDATLLVNTLTFPRPMTVEVDVAAPQEDRPVVALRPDGSEAPVQEIARTETVLADETMDASDLHRIVRRIHRRELFGQDIDHYEIAPGKIVFHVARVPQTAEFDLLALRARIDEAAAQHPGPWQVLTLAEPRRRVLVKSEVPASGSLALRVVQRETAEASSSSALRIDPDRISNGLITARLRPDGTIDVTAADGTRLSGVGALVDEGDRGDSYNYGPVREGVVIDMPAAVTHEIRERGPLRCIMRVRRSYSIPASLSWSPDQRSHETVMHEVTTDVEVRDGEPFVRLTTTFVNRAADHRVRMRIPLSDRVDHSFSEGQFSVTRRGLENEGGWGEYPLPTYPATSFVSAGGVTALLSHATEYEVTQDGRALELTLLRAVGSISVNLHPLRDEPAASEIAIPGAQEIGATIVSRIAIMPSGGGWQEAGAVTWAEQFRADDLSVPGGGRREGELPDVRHGLSVDSPDVQVTSVRRIEDAVELRLVAMSDQPVSASVSGDFTSAQGIDLLGRPLGESTVVDGALPLTLAPWEIFSVLLR